MLSLLGIAGLVAEEVAAVYSDFDADVHGLAWKRVCSRNPDHVCKIFGVHYVKPLVCSSLTFGLQTSHAYVLSACFLRAAKLLGSSACMYRYTQGQIQQWVWRGFSPS